MTSAHSTRCSQRSQRSGASLDLCEVRWIRASGPLCAGRTILIGKYYFRKPCRKQLKFSVRSTCKFKTGTALDLPYWQRYFKVRVLYNSSTCTGTVDAGAKKVLQSTCKLGIHTRYLSEDISTKFSTSSSIWDPRFRTKFRTSTGIRIP